jgi:hypothetical protein
MHVSAGAAGAMLTITLLHQTELSFDAGQVVVVHDPLGLTAERLLAHVYRVALERGSEGPWRATSAVGARWLAVQSPLAGVWQAVDTLQARRWRPVPERGSSGGQPALARRDRPLRVAEARHESDFAVRAPAGLLLLSESTRPDALSPGAAARLLERCLRRGWAALAATREGPLRSSHNVADGTRGEALLDDHTPSWRSHVVCESGMLRPVVSR